MILEIGSKVRLHPRKGDAESFPYWGRYEGFVATVRSLGVIPTVWIGANTNAGRWWVSADYDEMELVSDETPCGVWG